MDEWFEFEIHEEILSGSVVDFVSVCNRVPRIVTICKISHEYDNSARIAGSVVGRKTFCLNTEGDVEDLCS